jgi:hypothetical protein
LLSSAFFTVGTVGMVGTVGTVGMVGMVGMVDEMVGSPDGASRDPG